MKTLRHLEKKKITWLLIGLCIVFFLFRFPSLIEPYWYGDEGIYQVIGLGLDNGRQLYTDIWDNKPPLLYITYALFGGDQFIIRFVSLFMGIAALVLFFFLAEKILKSTNAAFMASFVFTLLFASPYLEGNIANAENFILPLTLTAALLVYGLNESHSSPRFLFIAGILLGLAFLFKIVAVFDFIAFSFFLILSTLPHRENHHLLNAMKRKLQSILPMISGFLIPVFITLIVSIFSDTLIAFINAAFLGNIQYVGYSNQFIIPQGLLIVKLLLFVAALTLIFKKRHAFTKQTLFVSIWLVFAVFSAFFSQRPYTHYLLVILPVFCLLIGLLFTNQTRVTKWRVGFFLIFIATNAVTYFPVFGVIKTFAYYENTINFLTGQKNVKDYQSFFDPDTPRDYQLVSFIKNHTSSSDSIFLWGDSPQIYYLTRKLPPGRYTVSYHVLQESNGIAETQAAIDKMQPKFIITLSEAPPLPFKLPGYSGKYAIQNSAIYERTF